MHCREKHLGVSNAGEKKLKGL